MAKGKKSKEKIEQDKISLPAFGLAEDILGTSPDNEDTSISETGQGVVANGAATDETTIKFVTFFLDKEEYGLPISEVQEINRVVDITRVPNSPRHVMGVMNLRGKVVPVIELKTRLNIGATEIDKQSRIVVVEHGLKTLGLMVDRVSQVLNITSDQIEDAPEEAVEVHKNYIKGVGKIDERMVILLDLGQVIGNGTGAE